MSISFEYSWEINDAVGSLTEESDLSPNRKEGESNKGMERGWGVRFFDFANKIINFRIKA
jgi:hypothetical protein